MGNGSRKSKIVIIAALVALPIFFSCKKKSSALPAARAPGDEIRALFVTPYRKADPSEFLWLQSLSKEYALNLRWEVLSEEEWQAQKEARLSSPDAPDVLINACTAEDYAHYPAFFLNLAQFVGFSTPNLSLMFKENKNLAQAATMYNGAVYAFPSYSSLEWQQLFLHSAKCVIFINQQWLKALELPIPDTFAELEEVLFAFRTHDCNGDGDTTDEIPFDFYGWDGEQCSAVMLLGGLGIQLTDGGKNGYFAENDEIKSYFCDTRYKFLLSMLARWYKLGFIRDAALTSDFEGFLSRSHGTRDGFALTGMVIGMEETVQFGKTLSSQYRPMLPPTMRLSEIDENAFSLAGFRRYWGTDSLTIQPDRISLSAQCPQKDAVIAFIDALYGTDWSVQSVFGGIADGVVVKNSDFDFSVHTDIHFSNSFGEVGPHFLPNALSLALPDNFVYAQLERTAYQKLQVKKGNYYPEMYMKYPLEQLKALSDMEKNISEIAHTARLRWIRGEGNIDSEWDSYCAALENAGLASALRVRQAAYNRYLQK